jgi:hypothetical protein
MPLQTPTNNKDGNNDSDSCDNDSSGGDGSGGKEDELDDTETTIN